MNVSPVQTLLPASPHLLFLLFSAQHCSWHHHHTSWVLCGLAAVSESHNRLHRPENFCRKVLHVVQTEVWVQLVQKLLVTTSSSYTHDSSSSFKNTTSSFRLSWNTNAWSFDSALRPDVSMGTQTLTELPISTFTQVTAVVLRLCIFNSWRLYRSVTLTWGRPRYCTCSGSCFTHIYSMISIKTTERWRE